MIAADVDKTILAQTEEERAHFLLTVAPHLVQCAVLGMELAFVTGNSMSQLTNRFLQLLLESLCYHGELGRLPHFHFFCNSGGVYFRFPEGIEGMAELLKGNPAAQKGKEGSVLDILTFLPPDGTRAVRPQFVDANYLRRTQIPAAEASKIDSILEQCGAEYIQRVKDARPSLEEEYNLSSIMDCKGYLRQPTVDPRFVKYIHHTERESATVQLTLKPVLSFRHGTTEDAQTRLFENDLRTEVIRSVQRHLDEAGLGHYSARPGGRSSIDVTLEKLDKAYAMEFLIDALNLQGHARLGQRFGSNAVYFGDEVIAGGGNDFAVTRIPGLLVFAVNPDKALIPFLSRVFTASPILEGPDATAQVLAELAQIAKSESAFSAKRGFDVAGHVRQASAIDLYKVKVFSERVHSKVESLKKTGKLTPDEWQVLHTFVTLMHRDDPSSRHWLAILVDELDAIMTQLAEFPGHTYPAVGTSHPDS